MAPCSILMAQKCISNKQKNNALSGDSIRTIEVNVPFQLDSQHVNEWGDKSHPKIYTEKVITNMQLKTHTTQCRAE